MSDLSAFEESLAKEADLARREKELKEKRLVLNERKTGYELEQLQEAERVDAINKNTNFGSMTEEQIQALLDASNDYIYAARNGMQFINPSFNGIVPFFRKNLILIGGKTGEGKSTTVANIARSIIGQKNPETGELRKVLVITNEEKAEDVYNRITCLGKGWAYVNHDKFTPNQVDIMGKSLRAMASKGIVTVVDNFYGGSFGVTTTLEGIKDIFDNLMANKIFYDCILIDYYQNIKSSRNDIYMNEFEVQAKLAYMLDQLKNEYPAPIVMLAQVKPPDKEREEPFEFRIKGRKIICDPSTFIMEMVRDTKRLRTEWIVHKSRFTESVGNSFFTGFDRGRFVIYDDAFQTQVNKYMEEKEAQKMRNLGIMREEKGANSGS